jgi:hypothetical protein
MYICSATKGLGRTQPADWQDAGEVLNHDGLKGCWMPKGMFLIDDAIGFLMNLQVAFPTLLMARHIFSIMRYAVHHPLEAHAD